MWCEILQLGDDIFSLTVIQHPLIKIQRPTGQYPTLKLKRELEVVHTLVWKIQCRMFFRLDCPNCDRLIFFTTRNRAVDYQLLSRFVQSGKRANFVTKPSKRSEEPSTEAKSFPYLPTCILAGSIICKKRTFVLLLSHCLVHVLNAGGRPDVEFYYAACSIWLESEVGLSARL